MNRFSLLFFYSAFLTGICTQFSQAQPSRFSMEKYIDDKGDTQYYRQVFPDADQMRRYPLVVFLHGSGERGHDNQAQLKWGVENFATDQNMVLHPAIIIAPQCPDTMSWANVSREKNSTEIHLQPTPSKPMRLLIELIHTMMKKLPIDSTRIYITGLSMGGFGTFDAIERNPGLFAAAVPVCGAGDTSKAPSIAHLPIWIFQGSEDPAVKPIYASDMFLALSKAGAHPGFTQYPETGHFSWLAAYSDARMMEWLFRQHK